MRRGKETTRVTKNNELTSQKGRNWAKRKETEENMKSNKNYSAIKSEKDGKDEERIDDTVQRR